MTPRDPEALQVAFRVLKTLEELGVSYHLGGSYASAIHGIPRQTHDVDLVVDVPQALVQRLVRDLEGEFYVDERAVARAVRDRTSVNLVHLGTGVKVDLFIKGTSEFDDSEFARRILLRLGDDQPRDVFVKSAEDTVLRKLLWFRLGGEASDRQWSDVCGIVGVQAGKLDVPYLTHWAERLGIRDLLDRLMGNV